MSLQTRIVSLVGAVLLVSIALGAMFAGLQARRALHAEIEAAMLGGVQTIRSAFEDLPRSDHREQDLRQLVATFNGNRHVASALRADNGQVVISSRPQRPTRPAPAWFRDLLDPAPSRRALVATGAGPAYTVSLNAAPDADLASSWSELSGIGAVLLVSALGGLVLVFVAVRAALSPLRDLSSGFAAIGRGDYRGRIRERGPSEILRLERNFNAMAERLADMGRRNWGLEQQILTLQDEERAELARDLHDDIGPHLFAVSLDAQLISQLLADGRLDKVQGQVEAIQSTVGHVQREVRGMVARLRPARVTELGLDHAILDVVRFWQVRRSEIAFSVQMPDSEQGLGDALKDTAFRVVQEAVNNAVRHSRPTRVDIALQRRREGLVVEVRNDGAAPRAAGTGFGILGMRERVLALGGALKAGPDPSGAADWSVLATLPTSTPALGHAPEAMA